RHRGTYRFRPLLRRVLTCHRLDRAPPLVDDLRLGVAAGEADRPGAATLAGAGGDGVRTVVDHELPERGAGERGQRRIDRVAIHGDTAVVQIYFEGLLPDRHIVSHSNSTTV